MHPENPGVAAYGRQIVVVPTGESSTSMQRGHSSARPGPASGTTAVPTRRESRGASRAEERAIRRIVAGGRRLRRGGSSRCVSSSPDDAGGLVPAGLGRLRARGRLAHRRAEACTPAHSARGPADRLRHRGT
jgi:hypothetical protein